MSLKVEQIGKQEPATIFRYNITMADMPVAVSKQLAGGTFPFWEFQPTEYRHGNFVRKLPGTSTLGDVELVFYETAKADVWKFFHDWRSQIVSEEGAYSLPGPSGDTIEGTDEQGNPIVKKNKGFKKTFSIQALDSKKFPVLSLKYWGAWPIRISEYAPASENREILQFTVNLSVDDVIDQNIAATLPSSDISRRPLPQISGPNLPDKLPLI